MARTGEWTTIPLGQRLNRTNDNYTTMKAIATLLSVLALTSLTVTAAEEGAKKKPKADPAKAFAKLDANSDGSLSKEEFLASPQAKKDAAKAEKAFGAKDKDGDGKLSKEEFTAAPKKKKKAE